MITRNIVNHLNEIVGTMSFEDGTSENVISAKLLPYTIAPYVDSDSYLKFSIIERKKFADDLLERFKLKNIKDGINAVQGMHMHHILRAYPVTFSGQSFTIDIMNLAISGDLEIACLSLLYGYTDDMSQSYHWMSADRKTWLINELKSFLGWI